MQPEQVSQYYPRLFHMAWDGSWDSIKLNGLLSSEALVEMYGLSATQKAKILTSHRPSWIEIESAGLPKAVIRDQRPMSDNGLRKALGGEDPSKWYQLINSMVFFWPTKERLKTMMSASAYKGMRHDLLIVDTARLIEACGESVRISPMNSGATRPFAHPRDFDLFKEISRFPFDERLRTHTVKKAVAEVCVLDRVDNIEDLLIEVKNIDISEVDNI